MEHYIRWVALVAAVEEMVNPSPVQLFMMWDLIDEAKASWFASH